MADTADPPSISRSGRSISVSTGDHLRCFLDPMTDHELYTLYLLAATIGMRGGEVAGLLWHNVDLEAARLTINQRIVSVQYQLIKSDLKTPPAAATSISTPEPSAIQRGVLLGQFPLKTLQHLDCANIVSDAVLLQRSETAISAFMAVEHGSERIDLIKEVVLVGRVLEQVKATALKIDVRHQQGGSTETEAPHRLTVLHFEVPPTIPTSR